MLLFELKKMILITLNLDMYRNMYFTFITSWDISFFTRTLGDNCVTLVVILDIILNSIITQFVNFNYTLKIIFLAIIWHTKLYNFLLIIKVHSFKDYFYIIILIKSFLLLFLFIYFYKWVHITLDLKSYFAFLLLFLSLASTLTRPMWLRFFRFLFCVFEYLFCI